MNKRSFLIGSLVVGLAFTFVLWDGDETPDSKGAGDKAQSAPDRAAEPSRPKFLPAERQHADMGTPPSRGGRSTQDVGRSTYPDYPRIPGASYPAARPAQDPMERFNFRPLTERERQRIEAEYPRREYPNQADWERGSARPADRGHEYPSAYDPAPAAPTPSDYAPYPAQPVYPGGGRPYSFRPLDKGPATRDRWQGPYQDRSWGGEQDYVDRWTAPSEPQWGVTAPARAPAPQRMYPTWDRDTGRKLTAR